MKNKQFYSIFIQFSLYHAFVRVSFFFCARVRVLYAFQIQVQLHQDVNHHHSDNTIPCSSKKWLISVFAFLISFILNASSL